jgi:hypothetical protein
MDNNLPLHVKNFNNKVRAMNQARGKILTLTVEEAQSLQAEIYDLMATISHLAKNTETTTNTVMSMDGGGFK